VGFAYFEVKKFMVILIKVFIIQKKRELELMTKYIVTFLVNYLHDYKNSHIFAVKD
jgi:hypothetical protein